MYFIYNALNCCEQNNDKKCYSTVFLDVCVLHFKELSTLQCTHKHARFFSVYSANHLMIDLRDLVLPSQTSTVSPHPKSK